MLKITDLTASKELAVEEMSSVRGGFDPFAHIDFSTGITSKVADVTQSFGLALAQGNEGAVTNNQAIDGGKVSIEGEQLGARLHCMRGDPDVVRR